MSAKTSSLVAKILGIVWIIVASALRGLSVFTGLSAEQIVIIGVSVALLFATVDINILADKIFSYLTNKNGMADKIKEAIGQGAGTEPSVSRDEK